MPTPTTTIRLPPELRRQLNRYAKANNKTNTDVVITALQEFLLRHNYGARSKAINHELERLADIDRADPEFKEFYGEPEEDPFPEPK